MSTSTSPSARFPRNSSNASSAMRTFASSRTIFDSLFSQSTLSTQIYYHVYIFKLDECIDNSVETRVYVCVCRMPYNGSVFLSWLRAMHMPLAVLEATLSLMALQLRSWHRQRNSNDAVMPLSPSLGPSGTNPKRSLYELGGFLLDWNRLRLFYLHHGH